MANKPTADATERRITDGKSDPYTPEPAGANVTQTPIDGRITVVFESPLKRGNHTIPEVQLRKPSSGELRGLSLHDVLQLDVTAMHKLLPRITAPALTENDVSQLDPVDLVALGGEIAGFFVPKTAKNSLIA